jgi:glucose-1-phosphate thymidylyltransferase
MTHAVSKQLLPIWDKPLIYYSFSMLMLAGIRDIMIITTFQDLESFKRLFGDGSQMGLKIEYAVQPMPGGIAQAFLIGADFVGKDRVALVLGDNLFHGHGLPEYLEKATKRASGATVFAYQVQQPERYGVVTFDSKGQPTEIVEKPKKSTSPWAVTGLYFYDNKVLDIAAKLKPSARGELEITDVNRAYLTKGDLHVEKLGRGIAWLDTGTPESLLAASNFIQVLEERQGLKVGCLEEIAYIKGFINAEQLKQLAASMKSNPYSKYLLSVLEHEPLSK